ncbi:MAG: hypothetical protein ABWY82_22230, partial [Tardiphaga sp.]
LRRPRWTNRHPQTNIPTGPPSGGRSTLPSDGGSRTNRIAPNTGQHKLYLLSKLHFGIGSFSMQLTQIEATTSVRLHWALNSG